MAVYKYSTYLVQHNNPVFDALYSPGTPTPHSGIYRCEGCGHNDVSTFSHPLPTQNHDQHPPNTKIVWRLIVATK